MKKLFTILFMLWLSISAAMSQSQPQPFKAKNKTTHGYATSFKSTTIQHQSHLKSAGSGNKNNAYRNAGAPLVIPKPGRKIIFDTDSLTPILIEQEDTSLLKSGKIQSASEKCFSFLQSIKQKLRIDNPYDCFYITNIKSDTLGQQHIRLSQKYNGIKVYGSDFYVHFSGTKEVMNGRYSIIGEPLNTTPAIRSEDALQIVVDDLGKTTAVESFTLLQKKILSYDGPLIDTVIIRDKHSFTKYSLVYYVIIRPNLIDEWFYFVDALSGNIIKKYNNTAKDGPATASAVDLNGVTRNIKTYMENGHYTLVDAVESMYNSTTQEGLIATYNALNTPVTDYAEITTTNNNWTNATAVSAHYNAYQSYLYFKNTFARNSINGQGGNIVSFINVSDKDGKGLDNAYWNGKFMCYGNGYTDFKPLAGGLDVAAHEMAHGVTQSTAGLEYLDQPGAINESFSDIFGVMVDRSNWYIGENVTKTSYIPNGRLRDMSNPHNGGTSLAQNGWQPMHTSEMYTGDGDNGGVHVNSGICNYAYYLFASAVTKEKAEQVYYRALTTYLTKSSRFIDLRIAIEQSVTDLYGAGSNELTQVKTAFDAVGIYEEQPGGNNQTFPVNPGTKYLLMCNTDNTDPYKLYRSSVTATNFTGLSTTPMNAKASVVDDGSVAVYVSTDHKIRAINLSTKVESVLSNDAIWDNVAVSKDGKRLAAITTAVDTAIYVYDFSLQKWAKFHLYNPTTEGYLESGGALYADAIAFDYSGEYLVYDAFNSFKSNTSESINYWDIGVMQVWDNKLSNFADGTIAKFFNNLPEGVSIGNPVFAKTNPNIIAFDYLDESTSEYAVFGLNVETMDLGLIANNVTVGYPSFSEADDKVAYSSINTSNQEVISVVSLNADKISASAAGSAIIDGAKWPVYYAVGTRVLGFAPVANFTSSYKTGKAPLTVGFSDLSTNDPTSWQWTFQGGSPGTSTSQNPSISYSKAGTYSVTLKTTNSFGNNTMVKNAYIVITNTTDVPELQNEFTLYPNPVKDFLYLKNSGNSINATVNIYSIDGRLVLTALYRDRIDMSNLKDGIYIVNVKTDAGTYQTKLMKE